MKRLLIIQCVQFGMLTDTAKYCEHLHNEYLIDFLTFDYGMEKCKPMANVKVIYVCHKFGRFLNAFVFLFASILRILLNRYDSVFVGYFPHCSLLKRVFRNRKLHVDIRTLSVEKDEKSREEENARMAKDISVFDSISFISVGVRDAIWKGTDKPTFILPLGADPISTVAKQFNRMDLLYVGTLVNRNILQSVEAVAEFIARHPDAPVHYDIVGSGSPEYESIVDFVRVNNLSAHVTLHGFVPYSQLTPFFDSDNIGISYVPQTEYFQNQPPTKTFEYAQSGLVCLATNTLSNKQVITPENGLIFEDNPQSLCDCLERFWAMRSTFDSSKIMTSLAEYSWENIVRKYLVPILEYKY